MITIKWILVPLAVLAVSQFARGEPATNEPSGTNAAPLRLALELIDGSRYIGVPVVAVLPVQTSYAKMEVPWERIGRVTIPTNREQVVFQMNNGDQLRGALLLKSLDLKTAFGKVTLGLEQIVKIDVGAVPCQQGLLAEYLFDGNARDSSGNGQHGQVSGAQLAPDRFGNPNAAYAFNGRDAYISFATSVGKVSEFTVSAWVYPTGNHVARVLTLAKAADYRGQFDGVSFEGLISDPYAPFSPNGENVHVGQDGDIAVAQNAWSHFVFTFDGNNAKFYVNGVQSGSTRTWPGPARVLEFNYLGIGENIGRFFCGNIDEIRIYNRALSAAEIKQINSSIR